MSAEIKKLRDDIPISPDMLIGMLKGYSGRIKTLLAVVVWDDESFQVTHSSMSSSQIAYSVALIQKDLLDRINDGAGEKHGN